VFVRRFPAIACGTRIALYLALGVKVLGSKTVRERDASRCLRRNVYLSLGISANSAELSRDEESAALAVPGTTFKAAMAARRASNEAGLSPTIRARHADSLAPIAS